ncbi:MAG: hypothetical protein ACTHK2_11270 [Dokdonella sp.]|uniref:hypothetical protein n=1 Tax=Dokdonella sp. TaxID=2291710 RepID=UPI003F7E077B
MATKAGAFVIKEALHKDNPAASPLHVCPENWSNTHDIAIGDAHVCAFAEANDKASVPA